MPTATVRVDEQTHSKLRELSCEMNVPMQDVLAKAVEAFRRQHFLEMANIEYAALRADPKAWAEEMEERRLFEATLLDDLEDDPYPLDND